MPPRHRPLFYSSLVTGYGLLVTGYWLFVTDALLNCHFQHIARCAIDDNRSDLVAGFQSHNPHLRPIAHLGVHIASANASIQHAFGFAFGNLHGAAGAHASLTLGRGAAFRSRFLWRLSAGAVVLMWRTRLSRLGALGAGALVGGFGGV